MTTEENHHGSLAGKIGGVGVGLSLEQPTECRFTQPVAGMAAGKGKCRVAFRINRKLGIPAFFLHQVKQPLVNLGILAEIVLTHPYRKSRLFIRETVIRIRSAVQNHGRSILYAVKPTERTSEGRLAFKVIHILVLTHRLQVCTRTQNGIQCLHILHVHSLEYVHVAVQGRKFVNIGVASGKEGRDLHRLVLYGGIPGCLSTV